MGIQGQGIQIDFERMNTEQSLSFFFHINFHCTVHCCKKISKPCRGRNAGNAKMVAEKSLLSGRQLAASAPTPYHVTNGLDLTHNLRLGTSRKPDDDDVFKNRNIFVRGFLDYLQINCFIPKSQLCSCALV